MVEPKTTKRNCETIRVDSQDGADGLAPLAADDLELLAMSAYLIARDSDYLDAIGRAYNTHLRAGCSLPLRLLASTNAL